MEVKKKFEKPQMEVVKLKPKTHGLRVFHHGFWLS